MHPMRLVTVVQHILDQVLPFFITQALIGIKGI